MESLAVFVAVLLLTDFSFVFVALVLSFLDNKVARGFTIALSALTGSFTLFLAISSSSQGTWIMALIVLAVNAISIWNTFRIKRNNEETKFFTSE